MGELVGTAEFHPQIDTGRTTLGGLDPGVADIDGPVGKTHQDVLENADAVDHLDPQLRREAMLPRAGLGVPTDGQTPFRRNRLHVGATLPVNRDAVVAESDRADDGFSRQRAAAATYLLEPRLLTAGSIDQSSKLLIRREVRERVHAIAPFLDLRGDPYLISIPQSGQSTSASSQHQYWVVEGFTHSSTYPYSAAVSSSDSDRYLRNSVKAVVDAYNGSVQLFISEPDDPLIQGWARVFPDLFQPLSSLPSSVRDHLRVPEELFDVQVKQLQRYHVEDPRVFYSGDDVWQVPLEVYDGEQISVRPYHITAQVQDRSSSEFLLLQPLTPLARPNLTAWLAARNDGENYGKLVQIDFPKDTPILGPEQVQALINQDPEISQLFGLWDRGGSQVVQGNLLVVPVGKCLLYVEPVYLRASKGGLPSLTRIVVSDGQTIAMADTLPGAIDQLMQKTLPPEATGS